MPVPPITFGTTQAPSLAALGQQTQANAATANAPIGQDGSPLTTSVQDMQIAIDNIKLQNPEVGAKVQDAFRAYANDSANGNKLSQNEVDNLMAYAGKLADAQRNGRPLESVEKPPTGFNGPAAPASEKPAADNAASAADAAIKDMNAEREIRQAFVNVAKDNGGIKGKDEKKVDALLREGLKNIDFSKPGAEGAKEELKSYISGMGKDFSDGEIEHLKGLLEDFASRFPTAKPEAKAETGNGAGAGKGATGAPGATNVSGPGAAGGPNAAGQGGFDMKAIMGLVQGALTMLNDIMGALNNDGKIDPLESKGLAFDAMQLGKLVQGLAGGGANGATPAAPGTSSALGATNGLTPASFNGQGTAAPNFLSTPGNVAMSPQQMFLNSGMANFISAFNNDSAKLGVPGVQPGNSMIDSVMQTLNNSGRHAMAVDYNQSQTRNMPTF